MFGLPVIWVNWYLSCRQLRTAIFGYFLEEGYGDIDVTGYRDFRATFSPDTDEPLQIATIGKLSHDWELISGAVLA